MKELAGASFIIYEGGQEMDGSLEQTDSCYGEMGIMGVSIGWWEGRKEESQRNCGGNTRKSHKQLSISMVQSSSYKVGKVR